MRGLALLPLQQRRKAEQEAEARLALERKRADWDRSPSERLEATLRLSATLLELSRAPRRDA